MATDTGKMKHGAQQTTFDDVSIADFTRILKEGDDFSLEADVRVNPKTTTSQVTAHQEFARLPISSQHQEVIASRTKQGKQFDPGG